MLYWYFVLVIPVSRDLKSEKSVQGLALNLETSLGDHQRDLKSEKSVQRGYSLERAGSTTPLRAVMDPKREFSDSQE